jgi:hypothetical protein
MTTVSRTHHLRGIFPRILAAGAGSMDAADSIARTRPRRAGYRCGYHEPTPNA